MSRKGTYLGGGTIVNATKLMMGALHDRDREEELQALKIFIRNGLRGRAPAHLPPSASIKLKRKVDARGGYRAWAQSHSQYKACYEEVIRTNKKEERKDKRAARKEKKNLSGKHVIKSPATAKRSIQQIRDHIKGLQILEKKFAQEKNIKSLIKVRQKLHLAQAELARK